MNTTVPGSPQAWYYAGREAFLGVAGGDRAAAAATAADAVVARSPQRQLHACAPACSACCHYPVGVTATEAAAIAAFVQRRFDAGEIAALGAALASESSWEERAAARTPCVLLGADGRCRVYAVRPVACRGWNALDRRSCEASLAGDHAAVLQPDAAAYAACLGVAAELGAAEIRYGGDGAVHELTAALRAALAG